MIIILGFGLRLMVSLPSSLNGSVAFAGWIRYDNFRSANQEKSPARSSENETVIILPHNLLNYITLKPS